MEYKTKISQITQRGPTYRGTLFSDLAKGPSSDALFLLLFARMPTLVEGKLFSAMLVCIMEHSMGVASSQATRYAISGGASLSAGVGAGLSTIGRYHGGAITPAMEMFYSWKDLPAQEIEQRVSLMLSEKRTLYGFGHKHYKQGDPRALFLLDYAKELDYSSPYLEAVHSVEATFEKVKGKKLYANIDGMIAAFLCSFGVDARLGNGIFLIGRVGGLVAQAHEELTCEKPVRRISESDIVYEGA